ncbi:MAG: Ig-like domain-containing protein [Chloroflexota bacterium]
MKHKRLVAALVVLGALALPGLHPAYAIAAGGHSLHLVLGRSGAMGHGRAVPSTVAASDNTYDASAATASKSGVVDISLLSTDGENQISLFVSVGQQSFEFNLPSSDFTRSGNSATLNTHGDLKGYGSIQITWSQKTTTRPKGSCAVPGDTSTFVYYSNPKGSANLKLPCVGTLASSFNGPFKGSYRSILTPTDGYFAGAVADASFTLPSNSSVYLQAYQGSKSGQKPQVAVEAGKSFTNSPLASHYQEFHVTLSRAGALGFSSGLGGAALDMTAGPSPFKGTKVSWKATTPAVGPGKSACSGTWTGGAQRTASVSGTFAVKTCVLSGSFPIKASTTDESALYSSSLKPQKKPALKFTGSSPSNGATGVSTSLSAISLTFTNQLQTGLAYGTLQGGSDTQYLGPGTMSNGNKTMTLPVLQPLQPNTTYTLNTAPADVYNQDLTVNLTFTTSS